MTKMPQDSEQYAETTQKVVEKLEESEISISTLSYYKPTEPLCECVVYQFRVTEEAIFNSTEHIEHQIDHSKSLIMEKLEEFEAGYIGPFEAKVFEGAGKVTVQLLRKKTAYEKDISDLERKELNSFTIPVPLHVKEKLDLSFDKVKIGENKEK